MHRPAIVAPTVALALLVAGCSVHAPQGTATTNDRSVHERSTADEEHASAPRSIVSDTANAVGNVVTLPVRAMGSLIGALF